MIQVRKHVGQYEDTIKIGERETVNLTGLF